MNIKIESGAKVQITDKPIYNIYGDVVQQKIAMPPPTADNAAAAANPPQGDAQQSRDDATASRQQPARQTQQQAHERRSFLLNVSRAKMELLYLLLSEPDARGRCFIDGDMARHNDVRRALKADSQEELNRMLRDLKPVDLNKLLFSMVFSGQDTDVHIVWRASANELLYLIDTMSRTEIVVEENERRVRKKLLDWAPGPRKWQLTNCRFLDGRRRKVTDPRTGRQVWVDDPVAFEKGTFSAQNYPKNTTLLDNVIDRIAPNKVKLVREEIDDDFKRQSNYREDNESSLTALESEGHFRSTHHKARE